MIDIMPDDKEISKALNVLNSISDKLRFWRINMQEEEKVRIIAERYGYEPQSRQCIEEMSELTQAINKLWRKQNFGGNSREIAEAHENVLEEIADVLIMIWQMKELLGIGEGELSRIINQKLDRQLERIYSKN